LVAEKIAQTLEDERARIVKRHFVRNAEIIQAKCTSSSMLV
jgi:hypothetical protein